MILEFLLFLLIVILLSISIAGYGSLLSKTQNDFFVHIFVGIIIISFLITFAHFFTKINTFFGIIIFFIGLIFFFLKKDFSISQIYKTKNILYILIIILFIPLFLSQKYHEDFGYYHLPYAIGLIEEKIIFGFANIDSSYVYNSIWLNLYSIFFLHEKNFDFLTLPSFLLFLSFILFSFKQLISIKKRLISDYFLLIVLFYLILKFTRISEFGVDLPSAIFSILTIYNFLRFSEINFIDDKKECFFLILIFSIFSILIKLSTIPIILLPTFIYLKYFNDLKSEILKTKFFLIYFLLIAFFTQQFIYTGCLFFPSSFTCLNVSWLNLENINLSSRLELINKSYFDSAKDIYTPDEYLNNFNWLHFWLKRNFIEILEHFSTIILPTIFFLFFQKKIVGHKFFLKDKVGLYLFLIFGFIFWLNFSPVYRFAIHLFLLLIFILLLNFLISKDLSKRTFLIFFVIFISYNFSKNIIRLTKSENIFLGVQKINNQYILNEENINQLVRIYKPDVKKNSANGWQGRLCWNIPFICSYNRLEVKKKNGYLIINKLSN